MLLWLGLTVALGGGGVSWMWRQELRLMWLNNYTPEIILVNGGTLCDNLDRDALTLTSWAPTDVFMMLVLLIFRFSCHLFPFIPRKQ